MKCSSNIYYDMAVTAVYNECHPLTMTIEVTKDMSINCLNQVKRVCVMARGYEKEQSQNK